MMPRRVLLRAGIELLGTFYIVHEHLGDVVAFKRDNALPRFGIFGLMREYENAVAAQKVGQAFVITDIGGFIPASGSADGVVGRGFNHKHFQTTLSLYLDNERAFVFKVAGEKRARREEFA